MSIITRSTFWPTRGAWRSMHSRGSMMHYQVWAINIACIWHRVLLLGLVHIVFAAIVAHDTIICNTTLWLVLNWFSSWCDFTGVDDAATHTLVEWTSHVQTILLIIYHAFSVSLAGGSKLILIISAMSTGTLVQHALILSLISSNLSHEVVVLGNHIASSVAGLLPAWLIPLPSWSYSPVLHTEGAVIVWALASLVHTLHVFCDNVILASLRWVLVHLAKWPLGLQSALTLSFRFWALSGHSSVESLHLSIFHLVCSNSAHVVQADLTVMEHFLVCALASHHVLIAWIRKVESFLLGNFVRAWQLVNIWRATFLMRIIFVDGGVNCSNCASSRLAWRTRCLLGPTWSTGHRVVVHIHVILIYLDWLSWALPTVHVVEWRLGVLPGSRHHSICILGVQSAT